MKEDRLVYMVCRYDYGQEYALFSSIDKARVYIKKAIDMAMTAGEAPTNVNNIFRIIKAPVDEPYMALKENLIEIVRFNKAPSS